MTKEGVEFHSREWEEQQATGSTDFGNISYAVPGLHPGFKIITNGPNHTHEFTLAARTEDSHWRTLRAAKCLTITAARIARDDNLFNQVLKDFAKGKQ
jgi:metal-dependent amidase/aminoacylase/carboxypeptidase family protein